VGRVAKTVQKKELRCQCPGIFTLKNIKKKIKCQVYFPLKKSQKKSEMSVARYIYPRKPPYTDF
jgi:hypothetical protein